MRFSDSKKGFTLIELLIVIAIIGLLSGIVLASLSIARRKAQASSVMQELVRVRSAIALYVSQNGTFPPDNLVGLTPTYIPSFSPVPLGALGAPASTASLRYDQDSYSEACGRAVPAGGSNEPLLYVESYSGLTLPLPTIHYDPSGSGQVDINTGKPCIPLR